MKRFLILATFTLSLGLAQVPEELQFEGLPGVDLCALFTVEELNELTGLSLTEEFDHWVSNGLYYGTIFIPDTYGPSSVGLVYEEGVPGVGEFPMNGRWCDYRGNGDLVMFKAYESLEDAHAYTGRVFLERAPGVYASNTHCYVEPAAIYPIVIEVWASSRSVEFNIVDMACKIIIDGNVALRSADVASALGM